MKPFEILFTTQTGATIQYQLYFHSQADAQAYAEFMHHGFLVTVFEGWIGSET